MQYHVGDFVICRVSYDDQIIFDIDFNDPKYCSLNTSSFEVIAITNTHYVLLVPINVEGNFNLSEARIQQMGIDSQYKDHWAFFIREEAIGCRVIVDYYSTAYLVWCANSTFRMHNLTKIVADLLVGLVKQTKDTN